MSDICPGVLSPNRPFRVRDQSRAALRDQDQSKSALRDRDQSRSALRDQDQSRSALRDRDQSRSSHPVLRGRNAAGRDYYQVKEWNLLST